jgi:hypothetical protein
MLSFEGNEDSPSLTITKASDSSWTTSDASDIVHYFTKDNQSRSIHVAFADRVRRLSSQVESSQPMARAITWEQTYASKRGKYEAEMAVSSRDISPMECDPSANIHWHMDFSRFLECGERPTTCL